VLARTLICTRSHTSLTQVQSISDEGFRLSDEKRFKYDGGIDQTHDPTFEQSTGSRSVDPIIKGSIIYRATIRQSLHWELGIYSTPNVEVAERVFG